METVMEKSVGTLIKVPQQTNRLFMRVFVSAGKGSGTPRVAALFMKANRNWLMEQVETITDHFSDE